MLVRAKFTCNAIEKRKGWTTTNPFQYAIKMSPVTSGSEENKKFFESSPGGQLELAVVSADVGALFEVGREYYLDFTPAEPPAAKPA